MNRLLKSLLVALMTCCIWYNINNVYAQVLPLNKDTVESILVHSPSFTIYKNNYFITGIPLDETPSETNSDVKFQVSFKQRLANKPLPLGIYPHIIYTQKTFWDIYASSSPFRESNYNPGLLLGRPIFKGNQLTGALAFTFEHESNGRDSIYSRSWNFISLSFGKVITDYLFISLKAWVPFVHPHGNNTDLIDYVGYGELELHGTLIDKRLFIDFVGRKGASGPKGSIQTDLSYKPFKLGNQYLSVQWFYGYAESLVDYSKRTNMLRLGIMFKPTFYRFY